MRPYTICHMMTSLDGRIDCGMTEQIDDTNHYYDALAKLNCPSTLEGKNTMAMHYAFPGTFHGKGDYQYAGQQIYKAVEAEGYAIGIDTGGTLLWDDNTQAVFGKPLLMILSERASKEYLGYLKSKGISYVTIGGRSKAESKEPTRNFRGEQSGIDFPKAMEILRKDFGIERLAVVGGGHINGTLLDLDLIDEVSMVYGYGIDGREGMAAAFDGRPKNRKPVRLQFQSVKERDGIVWIRYLVNNCKL